MIPKKRKEWEILSLDFVPSHRVQNSHWDCRYRWEITLKEAQFFVNVQIIRLFPLFKGQLFQLLVPEDTKVGWCYSAIRMKTKDECLAGAKGTIRRMKNEAHSK